MNEELAKNFLKISFKNFRLLREKMDYSTSVCHLSGSQLQTLSFLKQKENAQMGEIAEYLHIELPSATSLLNKLVALQLVKRQQDDKDRRMVRVALTEEGKKVLEEAMKEKIRVIGHMLSYLTEKEQTDLLRLLEKLNERIEKDL